MNVRLVLINVLAAKIQIYAIIVNLAIRSIKKPNNVISSQLISIF